MMHMLQQYLPLAVLKLTSSGSTFLAAFSVLQQYLPLAVLKLGVNDFITFTILIVATVLTACGIETR